MSSSSQPYYDFGRSEGDLFLPYMHLGAAWKLVTSLHFLKSTPLKMVNNGYKNEKNVVNNDLSGKPTNKELQKKKVISNFCHHPKSRAE